MSKIRSPGVYIDPQAQPSEPRLDIGPTGQAAFLGLTTRGPLHTPVRITNFQQFLDQFGAPLEWSYLPKSVKGYFENGGEVCYVVRVAHTFRRGRSQVATKSQSLVQDQNGEDTLRIEARDEGTWGNDIRVSIEHPKTTTQTFITRDLSPGERHAFVRSIRGFQVGQLCRIHDGENEQFVTINKIEGKELGWLEPLKHTFKSSAPTYFEPITFNINAEIPGYREQFVNLSFSPLSNRYFERYINAESRLIRVHNLKSSSPFPQNLPQEHQKLQLVGGTDGLADISPYDFIGFNNGPDKRFGLGALEVVDDVDTIVIPDLYAAMEISMASKRRGFRSFKDIQAVQQAMLDHCEKLRTRIALIDAPPKATYDEVVQWRAMFDSAFGALYYPWLVTDVVAGRKQILPTSSFAAGIIARSDSKMGVFNPPANEEIHDVVDLHTVLTDDDLAHLNRRGVNCIKHIPFRGIRIWGARTLSSDPMWNYINVRRIVSTIQKAVDQYSQWIVFEPNDRMLWKRVEVAIASFLTNLWREGYFRGETPEDSFYVLCDESTNPPEAVDAGILQCEIGLAPVRPAEFIVFNIQQHMEHRAEHNRPDP